MYIHRHECYYTVSPQPSHSKPPRLWRSAVEISSPSLACPDGAKSRQLMTRFREPAPSTRNGICLTVDRSETSRWIATYPEPGGSEAEEAAPSSGISRLDSSQTSPSPSPSVHRHAVRGRRNAGWRPGVVCCRQRASAVVPLRRANPRGMHEPKLVSRKEKKKKAAEEKDAGVGADTGLSPLPVIRANTSNWPTTSCNGSPSQHATKPASPCSSTTASKARSIAPSPSSPTPSSTCSSSTSTTTRRSRAACPPARRRTSRSLARSCPSRSTSR